MAEQKDGNQNVEQTGDQQLEQEQMISLSLVKKARKQVEDDARLLANRIALLKQEEIKTFKKIEETKKKALEIYHLKQKNDTRLKKRVVDQERQIKQIKQKKQNQKEKDELARQSKKDLFEAMKKEHYEMVKREKNKLKKKFDLNKKKVQEDMQLRSHLIRQQKEQGRQKVQEFYSHRHDFFRNEHKQQFDMEEHMKQQKEAEIMRMEKLENDLINKLQASQMLQKNAYEELESALTLNASEFATKYLGQTHQHQPQNKVEQIHMEEHVSKHEQQEYQPSLLQLQNQNEPSKELNEQKDTSKFDSVVKNQELSISNKGEASIGQQQQQQQDSVQNKGASGQESSKSKAGDKSGTNKSASKILDKSGTKSKHETEGQEHDQSNVLKDKSIEQHSVSVKHSEKGNNEKEHSQHIKTEEKLKTQEDQNEQQQESRQLIVQDNAQDHQNSEHTKGDVSKHDESKSLQGEKVVGDQSQVQERENSNDIANANQPVHDQQQQEKHEQEAS